MVTTIEHSTHSSIALDKKSPAITVAFAGSRVVVLLIKLNNRVLYFLTEELCNCQVFESTRTMMIGVRVKKKTISRLLVIHRDIHSKITWILWLLHVNLYFTVLVPTLLSRFKNSIYKNFR